jgi:cysteine peptidase B
MKTYDRQYANEAEYLHRLNIFKKNLVIYAELDARSPYASFGVTKFSDLSQEEFAETYLMKNLSMPLFKAGEAKVWNAPSKSLALPTSYSWQSKGGVTPVKNQGQCGSCWAFSATEAIESQWFLAGKVNPIAQFSPEQIVQCDPYDAGCNGGWPYNAYKYVIGAGGIDSYSSYPYTSGNGQTGNCIFKSADIAATISSWQWVTQSENEQQMQQFTYTTGPPSVCVDAATWSGYNGGVITAAECGTSIDHCVQIVGWDVVQGLKAWLVRNSWGTSWGYSGYLYVEMGADACGIASTVTSPIV